MEDPWIPLFDGESLEGWIPKFTGQELGVNYRDTFRVEDGLLKVCYDEWDEFGALTATSSTSSPSPTIS